LPPVEVTIDDIPVVSKSRAALCQSITRSTGDEPSSFADTYTERADSARW
jgi:hypothetical protein